MVIRFVSFELWLCFNYGNYGYVIIIYMRVMKDNLVFRLYSMCFDYILKKYKYFFNGY